MNTQTTTADVRQSHYVGVTLSIEQYEALRDEARAAHRTIASQMRVILNERYGVCTVATEGMR